MAAKKKTSIKLNEKQSAVLKNLNTGIAELQGRMQSYIEGMKDSNNIPPDFFPTSLDADKGELLFERADISKGDVPAPKEAR